MNKSLYGLKQAPRAWYENIYSYLKDQRFNKNNVDQNIY